MGSRRFFVRIRFASNVRFRRAIGSSFGGFPREFSKSRRTFWSNAIKFSKDGGTVRVRVEREGDVVTLVVSDDGIGIAKDAMGHIFERFNQADCTLTRSHGRLGRGLAIVKHIVDLHGGTIVVASEGPSRGSTFTVTFPAIAEDSTRMPVARAAPTDLHGVRVLVVEDDPDGRALMRFALERSGARVTDVESAAHAFEALNGSGDSF